MTQRIPRRSRLVSAIRAALHPATATALTVSLTLAAAGSVQAAMENGAPGKAALRPENMATRDEILFVDAHVIAPERLLIGTKQGVETIILEEGRDGLEQITEILETRHPVAVHIVAHGENGRLQLGDTWLDARRLDENVALIRRWFSGTNSNNKPDLLLYACNLAEGVEGVAFIEKLAEISGADVAASDDLTGHADLDGDWDLEVVTGDIEADLAFSDITINDYKSTLGGSPETFTVNDSDDNPGNTEACDIDCTLRDALYAANENSNPGSTDTVNFDFSAENAAKGGFDTIIYLEDQIEISEPVNIVGLGITELAVDAESESRIFDIESAEAVTISDMTLRDGEHEYGGCINSDETDLTLNETAFEGCESDDEEYAGGAIYFYGSGESLTVRDSDFDENYSYGAAGAIFFRDESGGSLLVENSDFTENYADEDAGAENAGGGAILAYVDETTVTIRDSEFRYNDSEEAGGGAIAIVDEGDSVVLIENSAFYENSALEESAGGGAVFVYMEGTEVTVRDSTFIENDAGYYGGGAIQFWDSEEEGTEASEVFIGNSYFAENYTYGPGGAILFDTDYGSALTIEDSQFIDNYAEEDGGGLAAYGESGDVVIRDSFFAQNISGEDGGGAAFDGLDTVSIYASTFYSNDAEENAGGIDLYGINEVEIVNSTFSYNETEGEGGAILTYFSDVYIRHTTIAFNDAESGGGLSKYDEEVVIENSIVSDNTAGAGPDLYGDTFDVAFSLVSDTSEATITNLGGNIFGASADLGPLTFIAGVSTPVHIPAEGSPVIDAGDPGFTPPPALDQRDEPRVLGASTDMGSVEQEGVVRIIPTLSNWGLAIMALLMAGFSFLGFKRRERES